MRVIGFSLIFLATALAYSGTSAAQDDKPEAAAAYSNDVEGLKKQMEDLLAAVKAGDEAKAGPLARNLLLPNAETWFKETFGEEVGARCNAEYAERAQDPAEFEKQVLKLFKDRVEKGAVGVKTHVAEGDEATGAQKAAIAAMKKPAKLYTVRFQKADGDMGFTLWSFVHVDGAFRLVGKLRAVGAPVEKP